MTSEVVENEFEFYSKAEKYWKDVPATVDGMLGGYGHISSEDSVTISGGSPDICACRKGQRV
uniref:N-terminal Xaa-Pro-Lys N-methyltransferase 1 n=1 Tax=Zonotrichia albicollis TaxID=44394 RepID=A0A8D2MDA0_ZONAL